MKAFKGEFTPGDVILANHPSAGGSHLPDLTVITPVFYKLAICITSSKMINKIIKFYFEFNFAIIFRNVPKPVFFVASRGHHADIGGITPGSMPPHSTSLRQVLFVFTIFLFQN